MPSKSFAFEPNGPKRLEIRWQGNYKNTTVYLDGIPAGYVLGRKDVERGCELTLPDGSTLALKSVTNILLFEDLVVQRDGKPLPGTAGDPVKRVRDASNYMFFAGAFALLIGGYSIFSPDTQITTGPYFIGFGLLYLFLGFGARRFSPAALWGGTLLFLPVIFLLLRAWYAGYEQGVTGAGSATPTCVSIVILVGMAQGIGAAGQARRAREAAAQAQAPVARPLPYPARPPAPTQASAAPAPIPAVQVPVRPAPPVDVDDLFSPGEWQEAAQDPFPPAPAPQPADLFPPVEQRPPSYATAAPPLPAQEPPRRSTARTAIFFALVFFGAALLGAAIWLLAGSGGRLPALLSLGSGGGSRAAEAPAGPLAGCKEWSDVSLADKGRQMCVYGTVKGAYSGGGSLYYLSFSDSASAFRFVDLEYNDHTGKIGQCVTAEGEVRIYGDMPYIIVGDTLKLCE